MARLIPSPTWAKAPPLQYHLLFISIVASAINVSVAHPDRLLHQVSCIGSVHLPAAIADKRYGAVGKSQPGGGDDGHGKARPAVAKLRGRGEEAAALTSVLGVLPPPHLPQPHSR